MLVPLYPWCILYEKSGMPVAQVGMSLAQIGEFAFILLSRASNLHLIQVLHAFVSSYVCATNGIHTVTLPLFKSPLCTFSCFPCNDYVEHSTHDSKMSENSAQGSYISVNENSTLR